MTDDNTPTSAGTTPVQFPPVPLLTGDALRTDDGTAHPLASVTLTITAEDGTTREVPLEFRFGGWWAPAEGI